MSRLSEALGVEENQEFMFEGDEELIYKISGCYRFRKENDGKWWRTANEKILCDMINHPEKIKILPTKPKLTEQQKDAIKGRIAEGTPWAVKDISGEEIAFYSSTPCSEDYYATSMNVKMYDFLKVGQAVYLPDLIGGTENE